MTTALVMASMQQMTAVMIQVIPTDHLRDARASQNTLGSNKEHYLISGPPETTTKTATTISPKPGTFDR